MPRLTLKHRMQGDRPVRKPYEHHLVKELRDHIHRLNLTESSVCQTAGVYDHALSRQGQLGIPLLEAIGDTIGLELVWRKKDET